MNLDTEIRNMCKDNLDDLAEEQTNFLSILAAFKHYRYDDGYATLN